MNIINFEALEKMAAHVESIPQVQFQMDDWNSEFSLRAVYNRLLRDGFTGMREGICGSAACIIGHAVTIPEEHFKPTMMDDNWDEYCYRITGISFGSNEFDYLFGDDWMSTDNSPRGAALRIRHFTNNGLPEDWYDQSVGDSELTYMEEA